MPLSTYADLKAAIGAWSFNRADLPAAELVALGEARLNRDLRLRAMEREAQLSGEAGWRLIALPDDFMAPVALWRITPAGRERLTPARADLTPAETPGAPRRWAVDGEAAALDRPLAEAGQFVLRYIGRLQLSAQAPANWLLSRHPDAYLSACLVEAALWAQDDDQAVRWQARYEACVQSVRHAETASRRIPLRPEPAACDGGWIR